jgi:hypothetical protein
MSSIAEVQIITFIFFDAKKSLSLEREALKLITENQ